ncbi:hypothetical protein PROFUN_11890 [Planoprotostelium fungivorum]|uniref:Uncharacterized protein n=1 Tax=Planoprotostelium fungivorum TaxID=1890364 RepID=A0A2P6N914_9EUKA|nr:hypothetical protein PROFUN_11890 [Planoprotostelium fungivorum]
MRAGGAILQNIQNVPRSQTLNEIQSRSIVVKKRTPRLSSHQSVGRKPSIQSIVSNETSRLSVDVDKSVYSLLMTPLISQDKTIRVRSKLLRINSDQEKMAFNEKQVSNQEQFDLFCRRSLTDRAKEWTLRRRRDANSHLNDVSGDALEELHRESDPMDEETESSGYSDFYAYVFAHGVHHRVDHIFHKALTTFEKSARRKGLNGVLFSSILNRIVLRRESEKVLQLCLSLSEREESLEEPIYHILFKNCKAEAEMWKNEYPQVQPPETEMNGVTAGEVENQAKGAERGETPEDREIMELFEQYHLWNKTSRPRGQSQIHSIFSSSAGSYGELSTAESTLVESWMLRQDKPTEGQRLTEDQIQSFYQMLLEEKTQVANNYAVKKMSSTREHANQI